MCIYQQGAQDSELCRSRVQYGVWRLINKAGRQLNSERRRFLCDSGAAIEHAPCER